MIKRAIIAALLLSSNLAQAQLLNKFGPVTGLMVGAAGNPQTVLATSANITPLFSCSADTSHFLNGLGTCTVPAGVAPSGAANLVYATPDGSSGAAALRALVGTDIPPVNLSSTANGGVLSTSILLGTNGGTNNGFFSVTGPTTALRTFTFPNASATVLTSNAPVTVAQGGTGATTLSGILKGNGTSTFTSAVSTDISGLFCVSSSTNYLRADGTCAVPAGSSAANPTGTVGPTAVNGSASTFLRSDGAPAQNLTAAYNWTGLHTFTAGGGTTPSLSVGTTGSQGILCVGNYVCNTNPTPGDPAHTLELVDNGGSLQGIRLLTYTSGAYAISPIHWARINGTPGAPTAILNGDNLMSMGSRGWDGSEVSQSAGGFEGIATENWTTSATGMKLQVQTVPSGGATTRRTIMEFFGSLTANTPTLYGATTGNSGLIYMPFVDSAGTRFGYLGHASTANASMDYESDAALNLSGNGGADKLIIDTSHNLTYKGVDLTPDTNTYTGTLTGVNATVTNTMKVSRQGNITCIYTDTDFTGTSNSNAMTITGTIPAGFAPAANRVVAVGNMQDNGVSSQIVGQATIAAGGTITLAKLNATPVASSTNWTTSGTKGINAGWSMCFPK